MEEYPRNLTELEANFRSEEACRAYLRRLRWGQVSAVRAADRRKRGRCEVCGSVAGVGPKRRSPQEPSSKTHNSVAGVVSRHVVITSQKNGASALGLQRVLGLTRYETAWAMLHKFRHAMVRPGRDFLTGRVEVDECYIGGPEEGFAWPTQFG